MAEVTILLATYNGSEFIRQQVDSVLAQTFSNFRLILSDDGSADDTPEILASYAREYPDRITHYRSGQRFGCAQTHFMHLLQQFHDTPYIMFCDQDDVWHPDKVEKTLRKIQSLESDPATPVLVHTDLRVVNNDLQETAPSFCKLSNLDGNRMALRHLIVQNVITGCTVMLNRALAELACRQPTPKGLLMHDWWLAILAASIGKTGFLDEATIDYRQHVNNSVGAKDALSPAYLWKRFAARDSRKVLRGTALQTQLFLQQYRDILDPVKRTLLEDYASTADAPKLKRIYIYLKHRTFKYGIIRVVAQLLGG